MQFEIFENESTYQITLNGDLDMFSSYSLEEELMKKIDKTLFDIHMDFSNVNYVDSSGIGYLMRLKTFSNKNDIKLFVTGISDEILRVFKMVKLDIYLHESLVLD